VNSPDELIRRLRDEINRCRVAKLETREDYDRGNLSLSILNMRLTEYDKRIADAERELRNLLADVVPPETQHPSAQDSDAKWDVFLSYETQSKPIADEINTRLTEAGLSVWQHSKNIKLGDSWATEIDTAIRNSERLVLLVTPRAMESRQVFNEWFYFYNKKKPIHILMVELADIHYQLLTYQYLDWREPDDRDWDELLRSILEDFEQPQSITPSPIVSAPVVIDAPDRSIFADLLEAARDQSGSIALSNEQITRLTEHKPIDLAEYYLGRVAEWSQPRYQLDSRFINLTLLLDKGEDAQKRWSQSEYVRASNLGDVLNVVPDPALVVLGAPGSGKSTLLRRFQMDHSLEQLRADSDQVTFFIQLNAYRDTDDPRQWLNDHWQVRYPDLPALDAYLREGHVILLLDALNEMPHQNTAEYHSKVGLWRAFTQAIVAQGNRAIFSCRSLDYSASLSSKDLRVPQIEVQPMSGEQVREFIAAYSQTHADMIWRNLEGTPQFDLFRTPIYLKQLLDQVERTQQVPKGKAQLFTQFVRQQIVRNLYHPLLAPNELLSERDHRRLTQDIWKTPFELPERGPLIPKLSLLAFKMQQIGLGSEGSLVRMNYENACLALDSGRAEDILKAGIALALLDEDVTRDEISFRHQLLQEYFAARWLSQDPNPNLVKLPWSVADVRPTLEETLMMLADSDPLPPLPQTGWEETIFTATPMSKDPDEFVKSIISHNLPLAARCAASPEVSITNELKREIQTKLIDRTQDKEADLRSRIAAGMALGEIGDPRFEQHNAEYGEYLLPPLAEIAGGDYSIGVHLSAYPDEKPAHIVQSNGFKIGIFPVTNAEYACFIRSNGYENEDWWDTKEALAWLRGEGDSDSVKDVWRQTRIGLQRQLEADIRILVDESRITSEQATQYINVRNMSESDFESWLLEIFPPNIKYREPEFWNENRLNHPSQPVVGICWHEARAYCNWLSAQTGSKFRLPTEAEFEIAARGVDGRMYPYGTNFDPFRSNVYESHIRRTTPVGILDNATPEGIFDLSGNAYTWTLSIYDIKKFPYPVKLPICEDSCLGSVGQHRQPVAS